MSVHTRNYVMFGTKLEYTEELSAKLDEHYTTEHNKLTAIIDGMCGEYIMLGHIIASSDEYGVFDKPVELEKLYESYMAKISDEITCVLGEFVDTQVIIFTHYT